MARDNGGVIGVPNVPTSTTATGVWSIDSQYQAKVGDTWPQRALLMTKSLRFNSASDDSLSRSPSSTGNRKLWTFSCWVKRSKISATHEFLITADGASANETEVYFRGEELSIELYDGNNYYLRTNRLFRDVSAWYHIVAVWDSGNATSTDRMKLYVNGERETSFSGTAYPTLNYDSYMNESGSINRIGRYVNDTKSFNGYMSEAVLIDGQALEPTSFGVANSDGVWTPIIYTGTFGTNGFNLQFENAAALGEDSSPNGNNFTVNNLTSIDQTTDYPVVNYATLNPLQSNNAQDAVTAPTNGNLTFNDTNNADWRTMIGTIGVSSGKWYWEVKATALTGSGLLGVGRQEYLSTTLNKVSSAYPGSDSGDYSFSYRAGGTYYYNGTSSGSQPTFTTGNIVMIALDMDNGAIYTGVNGTWNNSGDPTSGASKTGASYTGIQTGEPYSPSVSASASNAQLDHNFGSPAFTISSGNADGNGYGNFEYAPPSGYYALNTANLAEFG